MPIAGAPRTASVRMQSATWSTVSQRIQRSSAGSARWSRIRSAPSSNRNGSTIPVCGAALTPSKLLRPRTAASAVRAPGVLEQQPPRGLHVPGERPVLEVGVEHGGGALV